MKRPVSDDWVKVKLSLLVAAAKVRGQTYLQDAVGSGCVCGEELRLERRAWLKLQARYGAIGLGDKVAQALAPVVRRIDASLGTNLTQCGGCKERQKILNAATRH